MYSVLRSAKSTGASTVALPRPWRRRSGQRLIKSSIVRAARSSGPAPGSSNTARARRTGSAASPSPGSKSPPP